VSDLLMSFIGDDFTGSTDAMESLARAGVRTVLFTAPPTPAQLARFDGLRAFGVASTTRSMPPDEMDRTLRPILASLKQAGASIVHYKVCSTFDSSPTIGSIGRVIEVGLDVFDIKFVPILAAAPALGRYCVFGNLFARSGPGSEPFRLDRHPSMSHHPVTPMDEADLRAHLAKQTRLPIALMDLLDLESQHPDQRFARLAGSEQCAILIDLLYERQLATAGKLIATHANRQQPLFVVGSSGMESALCAHWLATEQIRGSHWFEPVGPAGPIVAVCGSCSPVTAAQVRQSIARGFVEIADLANAAASAVDAIGQGRSVVIHSQRVARENVKSVGPALGGILREVLSATPVRRVLIAGGDTSGQIARVLGIESMEMIAELTRGSPLCLVTAPGSPADGLQMTFKGGQIGREDFFRQVEQGIPDA
jgi:uncharacterized protein YgbK (DUF1537 family)